MIDPTVPQGLRRAAGASWRPVTRRSLLGGVALAGGAAAVAATAPGAQAMPKDAWIASTINRMTLPQKVGQLFQLHVYGKDGTTPDPRNLAEYGVATPAEVVQKYHLGGVIYFAWADNLPTPTDCAKLSNGLQQAIADTVRDPANKRAGVKLAVPLSISTDQETGSVVRMPDPPSTVFPGAMALGAGGDTSLTEEVFEVTGEELRAVGINWDFAPDADVNVNPANPVIGVRSFGSNPTLVQGHVASAVRGLQRHVSSCAKHFPGHGDTDVDSHTGFPVITHTLAQWNAVDRPPFEAAIEAGIDSIMTAHLDVPALDPSGDPATLSKPIITGMLRQKMGFDGVVVTDSLGMQGVRSKYGDAEVAVRAIEAGVDVLLNSPAADVQWNAVLAAVKSGRISKARLDQSLRRILALKWKRGVIASPMVDVARAAAVVGQSANKQVAQRVADQTITLLRDTADLVPLPPGSVLLVGHATSVGRLTDRLTQAGATVQRGWTGTSPSEAQIGQTVAEAGHHATTVVLSYNASPQLVRLVAALNAAGRPTVVVAVANPYDIARLGQTPTYLISYGQTAVSMQALAGVLTGRIGAAGRLPVDIPSASDPNTLLFRIGEGLPN